MMSASVRFFQNGLLADMTCKESELRTNLQNIGILIMPGMITLDNARTLQITLIPDDETGRLIYSIVNKNEDTLGMVNRLCRSVYCMDECVEEIFVRALRAGKIKSVKHGLRAAEMLRKGIKKCIR